MSRGSAAPEANESPSTQRRHVVADGTRSAPGGRPLGRALRRVAATGLAAVTAVGALPLVATPAAASLAGVGPVSTVNGFPEYFEDAWGLRLRLCDDPAAGCTMATDIPDPSAPLSFPSNYPGESFYFAATSEVSKG